MVLVFPRLFSHFEQIYFFARTGVIVKWEETARIRLIFGVEWEKYMKSKG
jgi:hypothetical protein